MNLKSALRNSTLENANMYISETSHYLRDITHLRLHLAAQHPTFPSEHSPYYITQGGACIWFVMSALR